jgi:hypothetical protein
METLSRSKNDLSGSWIVLSDLTLPFAVRVVACLCASSNLIRHKPLREERGLDLGRSLDARYHPMKSDSSHAPACVISYFEKKVLLARAY